MKPSKLLPILTLAACTKVNSNLPSTTAERCSDEIEAVVQACEEANVVGTNENPELDKAVSEARVCLGDKVKIVCSDTDMTKITTFYQI